MINHIKYYIKKYIYSKKKYIFVFTNKYYKNIGKEIFVRCIKKDTGVVPNIFFTKKEFIEKASKKKITNNWIYFFYNYIKLFDNIKINKNSVIFFNKLLNDLNYIDSNYIKLKRVINSYIDYYKISRWYPNKFMDGYYNRKKKIKEYIWFYNKIKKKKYVYYGLALKMAYYRINNFFTKHKDNKFIFIGKVFTSELEKKIKAKIKKNCIFISINNKGRNKETVIRGFDNNIDKYIYLKDKIINNYKKKINTTIIFSNNDLDNLLFNYISNDYLKKINYNLYYRINKIVLHDFINSIFFLFVKKLSRIKYSTFFNFINNKYIKYFLEKNKLTNIINATKKKKLTNSYILFNLKYFRGSLFYIILNKKIKPETRILYFKKIINKLNYQFKINSIEKIYLKRINKFLLFCFNNVNRFSIENIYIIFKYFIGDNKINIYNFNYKSYIEILNYDFLYEKNIVNNLRNGILILNKKYDYSRISDSNFFNIIGKKINYINKKSFSLATEIFYNFKKLYVLYSNKDKKYSNNFFFLLKLLQNKNTKIIKPKDSIKINYVYNEKIGFNIDIKNRLNLYFKNKGLNFTSLKCFITDQNDFFYKYILGNKEYDDSEPKIFGKIIHKILYFLYKKYINQSISINNINKIKKSIKGNKFLKNIYIKYYSGIRDRYYFNYNYKITKKIILDFIKNDEKLIKGGNKIKIVYLEKYYKIKLFKDILFTGKIDRIDKLNGSYRIIDYKTYLFLSHKTLFNYKKNSEINKLFYNKFNENILQLLLYSLIFITKKKYNNISILNSIYYPNIIKILKINYCSEINISFIKKVKRALYKIILYSYKIKFFKNISYFNT